MAPGRGSGVFLLDRDRAHSPAPVSAQDPLSQRPGARFPVWPVVFGLPLPGAFSGSFGDREGRIRAPGLRPPGLSRPPDVHLRQADQALDGGDHRHGRLRSPLRDVRALQQEPQDPLLCEGGEPRFGLRDVRQPEPFFRLSRDDHPARRGGDRVQARPRLPPPASTGAKRSWPSRKKACSSISCWPS